MLASSGHHRQARRSDALVHGQAPESVGPSYRENESKHLQKAHENGTRRGVKIAQSVGGGEQAEVHTQGQNQLDQLRTRFAHFHDGGPKKISKDQADEVEILRKLNNEVR